MGMIYGYCRISTPKQSIDRQVANIKVKYPDAMIIKEVYTGTSMDRIRWPKLFERVAPGDTIIFDEVSRMSRNAEEGFDAYKELFGRGVNLVFLKEPHINTDVYRSASAVQVPMTGEDVDDILEGVNKYLMKVAEKQIRLAFERSQAEVDLLKQRTSEGMQTAKDLGKQIGAVAGRKLHTKQADRTKAAILKHSKAFGGTLTDKEVIKLAEVSPNTYYKYKAEIMAEEQA